MCLAFLVYKEHKTKLGSACREIKMQFSGPTLRLFDNFYIEFEQFCCSRSAAKACIWNIRADNKILLTEKFVFPHQECYGTQMLQARELDEF